MVTFKAEVEKRKCSQVAWGDCDETGGCSGGDEGTTAMSANAPRSVMVGALSAGVFGMIRGGLRQWRVRFLFLNDGACLFLLMWWV